MFIHNHLIKFQDTVSLPTVPGYMTELSGRRLSWISIQQYEQGGWPDFERVLESWKPLFRLLRESRRPLSSGD